jgi:cytochrome oxidase Cu insertion factor (SCO1/SenC/PrrC family)
MEVHKKVKIISPVISLGELEVYDIKNDAVSSINDKWTLVFFVESECNQFCEDKLYEVRQIRLALGKDRDKVERLLVSRKIQSWETFSDSFNGQKYIDPKSKDYERLVKKFEEYPKFDYSGTYLIDPFGFLMMKYKLDANPMGTIKDIERLIRNQK